MSDYSSLKATINANIKANNNHEITGAITNSVLNAMVNSLGAGYQFMGVATPTNPGSAQTPDYKCFYLATTPGPYTNLGGLVVAEGEVAILKYDTAWTKEVTGVATADQVSQLGQELEAIGQDVEGTIKLYQGGIDGYGIDTQDSSRVKTPYMNAPFSIVCRNGYSVRYVHRYNRDAQGNNVWLDYLDINRRDVTIDDNSYVYRVVFKNDSDTSISPDENIVETFKDVIHSLERVIAGHVEAEIPPISIHEIPPISIHESVPDFYIADETYNKIIRLADGEVKTKNFDSKDLHQPLVMYDFAIRDNNGNSIVRFSDGHIETKNFNSKNLKSFVNLKGKRVAFLGDSITQGAFASSQELSYHGIFCSLMGAIDRTAELYYERGESSQNLLGMNGTCIANNTKNNLGSVRFVTRATAENFADSKLIVVFGGTNDLPYDSKAIGDLFVEETITPTGNMGDKKLVAPTDTDTFAGALHNLIQTIQSVAPLVPIVFVTPLHRDHNSAGNPDYLTCNSNGDFMIDFVNAIKEICAFYAIPVLDLYSDSNLNPLAPQGSTIFADGLHPGDLGHRIIGELLYEFVTNNVVIE